jgi:pyruvoyl-dependent arginine decarboxylase (PvlArgDC)
MKYLILISLLVLSSAANAQSNETDKLIGAVVGGVIGSTIGDGDGQKIATALGALIGARMADGERYERRDFIRECRRNVPAKYRNNDGARKAWIEGCISNLERIQADLEVEAYNEGLKDGSTNK